jgi:hypothetical protein
LRATYDAYEIYRFKRNEVWLEARFAEIDIASVRKQLNDSRRSLEKIPATLEKIIAKPRFPQIITKLFRAGATHTAVV